LLARSGPSTAPSSGRHATAYATNDGRTMPAGRAVRQRCFAACPAAFPFRIAHVVRSRRETA